VCSSDLIVRDFNSITCGNEMKFYVIRKDKQKWNFAPADEIVKFAEDNNIKMRGHTLVWHNAMPAWLENGQWTKEDLLALLKEYITTVVTRYKGKLYCWDVVNEVFSDNGMLRDGATSVWYRACGEDYIENAFLWAHEADPDAKLFINDFNIETVNIKSTALYNYVKKMLAKKIPVQGVGFQVHLTEENPPNFASFYANVKRFTDLGLEVHFTEVDVRIKSPANDAKYKHQADIYSELFKLALNFEKVTNITVWGISDAHSWIPSVFPGYSNPLLFDKHFNPKPAYYAIEVALQTGPVTPTYDIEHAGRHIPVPFIAAQSTKVPAIDGIESKDEWKDAVIYPFGYNRLDPNDERIPDGPDSNSTWRLMYNGNTVFGLVSRSGSANAKNAPNDNIEISFGTDDKIVTLRTVAGHDFDKSDYKENKKAVWNKDGTACEFTIDLMPPSMEGKIIGWNISISSDDGKGKPAYRLFPLPGTVTNKKGDGFGEIEFSINAKTSEREGKAHIPPQFRAIQADKPPVIDGKITEGEWDKGVSYSFVYNQLDTHDLSRPAPANLSGDWRIVYSGKTIYGMVRRKDDITNTSLKDTWQNDTIEIFFDIEGVFTQLRTLVGKPFENVTYTGKKKAKWSKEGDILEFSIELPVKDLKGMISGWNIALSDNDGKPTRDRQLYALPGTNISWKDEELGEISFE
jgi:endo-1,4-beta-xylanase